MNDKITVKGAKAHNLKNIDVTIPRNKMVVFTGLSGSGKSSLVFDTIFAEGQRRYIESLSSYARQFLGQLRKPDVEYIEGLSPSISIDQKTTSNNPRSTVGTVTEIYDYMRLLFANIGTPHCINCGKEITKQTIDQITDKILKFQNAKVQILAPVVRGRKGEYSKLFKNLQKQGFLRIKLDNEIRMLDEDIELEKNKKHNISVIVDRIVIKEGINRRLVDSLETALKLAEGIVVADIDGKEVLYSTLYACPDCNISIEELAPRLFSFNSPYGACPNCLGLGYTNAIDIDLLIPDKNKSINKGALTVSGWNIDNGKISKMQFRALSKLYNFSLDTPFKDLSDDIKNILLYGSGDKKIPVTYSSERYTINTEQPFEGVANNLMRRFNETNSDYVKREIGKYIKLVPCKVCHGKRLKKEALAVTVGGKNISELCDLSIKDLKVFFEKLKLTDMQNLIAKQILKEINARLNFLINVGLNYLTLSRFAGTLSGGESQRIRLATQIGSGLTGVLYVLDEPSIGLHQRDNERLLNTLENLKNLGNSLLIVEHDEETMRKADCIVDIGPGAGIHGGELIAQGSVEDIMNAPRSITGKYLSGEWKIDIPKKRRQLTADKLIIKGAKQNNLKNINVNIPLGVFNVITGVSGSGKSSLINEILYPHLANKLNKAKKIEGNFDEIIGLENLDKVIQIDQSPIGRTPRSNPATYTNVFNYIRELFASTPDAKAKGYKAGRFSFNVASGRCENCHGDGIIKIEMHFLPDIYIPCDVCKGSRYNRETLDVKYKGKNISDVLNMTVEDATIFFQNIPSIYKKMKTLYDVGLGYIKLGQSSTTLSGGEAQRVKLATELSKRSTGKTLYILDEPTTGLHTDDIKRLIAILQRLVDRGNTVVVIEHNLDVIKVADHIIDLGPEGGDNGGTIVATGTPEQIAKNEKSYTGQFLKKILK